MVEEVCKQNLVIIGSWNNAADKEVLISKEEECLLFNFIVFRMPSAQWLIRKFSTSLMTYHEVVNTN